MKPRWTDEEPNDVLIKKLGEEIEVNCSMAGIPTPKIHWSRVDVNTGDYKL